MLKGHDDNTELETRGFDVEVLLKQGFNKSNPRGDDSLWCR